MMFTGVGVFIPCSPEMHMWTCILDILCMISLYTISTVREEIYFKILGLSFNLEICGFSVMYPIEPRFTCYPILSWAGGQDHIPSFLSQVLLCFASRWWLLCPLALSFLGVKDWGKWILISTLCCRTVKYLISIKKISKWSFWFIEHILHV